MAEETTQTTVAAPQKLTWDAPDGKHYEGSAEELFKISSERYNNLFPEYSKIKTEAQAAREQLEVIQQATTGRETHQDSFSNEKYWQLMQSNPLEAQRYANQFDPDYQRAVTDLRSTRQNQEAAIFKSEHADFEANEANVEKLSRTCQELFPKTDVYTSRQLSAAHALAFAVKPAQATTSQTVIPAIPPNGSASTTTGAPDIGKMTQDQLKAYILQLEQQGRTQ